MWVSYSSMSNKGRWIPLSTEHSNMCHKKVNKENRLAKTGKKFIRRALEHAQLANSLVNKWFSSEMVYPETKFRCVVFLF